MAAIGIKLTHYRIMITRLRSRILISLVRLQRNTKEDSKMHKERFEMRTREYLSTPNFFFRFGSH